MQQFLKVETQMFPVERIETLNLNATIGGETGVEVKLFGINETFQYTGQYASVAWDVLNGVKVSTTPPPATPAISVLINNSPTPVSSVTVKGYEFRFVTVAGVVINADDIEWVDFASQITPTQQGVELRVATDAPGVTRKFVDKNASEVYDVLVALASTDEVAAAV